MVRNFLFDKRNNTYQKIRSYLLNNGFKDEGAKLISNLPDSSEYQHVFKLREDSDLEIKIDIEYINILIANNDSIKLIGYLLKNIEHSNKETNCYLIITNDNIPISVFNKLFTSNLYIIFYNEPSLREIIENDKLIYVINTMFTPTFNYIEPINAGFDFSSDRLIDTINWLYSQGKYFVMPTLLRSLFEYVIIEMLRRKEPHNKELILNKYDEKKNLGDLIVVLENNRNEFLTHNEIFREKDNFDLFDKLKEIRKLGNNSIHNLDAYIDSSEINKLKNFVNQCLSGFFNVISALTN